MTNKENQKSAEEKTADVKDAWSPPKLFNLEEDKNTGASGKIANTPGETTFNNAGPS